MYFLSGEPMHDLSGVDTEGHAAIPDRPHDETNPIISPGSQ
jgi:hypothetical protein